MNLVLEIVLVVCCIGVTYSSPTNITGTDVVSSEKLPQVNTELPADHNKNDPPSPSAKPMQVVPTVQSVKDAVIQNSTNSSSSGTIDATNMTTNNKNVSSAKAADTVPSPQENNSSTSAPAQAAVSTEKSKGNTTTVPPTPASTSAPASTSTEKSKVTTTAGTPISSVTTPLAAKADKVMPERSGQERQFDSPSFIGGIVLTVGLTAIGFIAFKFYKSGTIDRNYRTL